MNRLTSAQSQATSGADCWGQSIPSTGYDRFGNLLTINSTQCSSPALSLSVSNKNRVTNTGFTYDNGGNETFDGLYSYTWDGESHLKSANGVNYTYDGDLRRVEKSNGKLYWYSTSGQVLEETDPSGNLLNDYIWVGGLRFARRDASGNVYYYLTDALGTTRGMLLNSNTTLCYDADFYPFGGEKVFTNTCAQNYKFTGLERDAESGLDDTLYRKYSSNLGRWLEADPVRGRISDPQSLNRYAYALNRPCTLTDALGLCGQNPVAQGYWDADNVQLRPGVGGGGQFGAHRASGVPHRGIDIGALLGTPVVPFLGGTVTFVGNDGKLGMTVKVDAGGGYTYEYGHLSAAFVAPGQELTADTLIGYTGTTGNARNLPASEAHVHLQLYGPGGKLINPTDFLSKPCPPGVQDFNPNTGAGGGGGGGGGGQGGIDNVHPPGWGIASGGWSPLDWLLWGSNDVNGNGDAGQTGSQAVVTSRIINCPGDPSCPE